MLSGGPAPALLLAAALLLWPLPGSRSARRARRMTTRPATAAAARRWAPPLTGLRDTPRRRRWVLAGAAGLATALAVGGAPGMVTGVAVAAVAEPLLRDRIPAEDAGRRRAALRRELPAACDLLAVCLAAGVPVGMALAAVGRAVPPPLGPQLGEVGGLYRLGAEPRRAWAEAPEDLGGLGRVLVRAGESGASVARDLRSLASDGRAEARAATEAAVRRAGVWILAPLGLCFLPAFVCLGVVPLVLGIVADVFG